MKTIAVRRLISVLLILAAASLACQSVGLGIFPTEIPTNTPEPTFTPFPSPTATLAAAATPPDGMTLDEQADGSTLYRDYDSGIEMSIPASWVTMSANMEDFQESLAQLSDENPEIASAMQVLSGMDADVFRVIAFDTENYTPSYVTNFTVIQAEDAMSASLPMSTLTEMTAQQLASQYPSATMLGSGVTRTSSGVEAGYLELELPLNLQDGTVFEAYQKQYYLTHDAYIIVVTFATPRELGATTVVSFDEIMDQLQFFEP